MYVVYCLGSRDVGGRWAGGGGWTIEFGSGDAEEDRILDGCSDTLSSLSPLLPRPTLVYWLILSAAHWTWIVAPRDTYFVHISPRRLCLPPSLPLCLYYLSVVCVCFSSLLFTFFLITLCLYICFTVEGCGVRFGDGAGETAELRFEIE